MLTAVPALQVVVEDQVFEVDVTDDHATGMVTVEVTCESHEIMPWINAVLDIQVSSVEEDSMLLASFQAAPAGRPGYRVTMSGSLDLLMQRITNRYALTRIATRFVDVHMLESCALDI